MSFDRQRGAQGSHTRDLRDVAQQSCRSKGARSGIGNFPDSALGTENEAKRQRVPTVLKLGLSATTSSPLCGYTGAQFLFRIIRPRAGGGAKLKVDRGNRSLADASGSERSWPSASLTSRHSYGARSVSEGAPPVSFLNATASGRRAELSWKHLESLFPCMRQPFPR